MAANPYDPVTTTDSTQLTDDWGLSLPPIRYKKYSGSSRFKSLCSEIRQHPRCIIGLLVVVGLVILLCIIIAVASSGSDVKHPTGKEGKWKSTTEGLEFYPIPEDGSVVINFKPKDFKNMRDPPLEQSLDDATEEYKLTKQSNSNYTDCNADHHPANKTCRRGITHFGDSCTPQKQYGYSHAQPCVLVKLKLPPDVKIHPIEYGTSLWQVVQAADREILHINSSYVPLRCEGATKEDKRFLNHLKPVGKKVIEYFPQQGFPTFFYRKRDSDLPFITPGVMVQFTSLTDRHMVLIKCLLLGQLYDLDDNPINHELLTINFGLYINHG